MGLEAHDDVTRGFSEQTLRYFVIAEHVFTILFSVELILRAKAYGLSSFVPNQQRNWWNFMDAILVLFTGILFTWIMPVLAAIAGFSSDHGIVRVLTVLRIVRLTRLVRVFQRVPAFREERWRSCGLWYR